MKNEKLYLLLFGNNCTSKKNLSHHYREKGFFSYTCTQSSHIPFRRKSNKIEIRLIIKLLFNVYCIICSLIAFAVQRYVLFLKQTNKLKYFFALFLQTVRFARKKILFRKLILPFNYFPGGAYELQLPYATFHCYAMKQALC